MMFFWIHEDRCVPDKTKTVRFMPFPAATGYFHDSKFFACFVSTKSYVLLSDGADDVTEYHVLRRQRSHVFLTLCFAQRERRSIHPRAMFCAGRWREFAQGGRRRTLRNIENEACQRTWRRQGMRDAGLAQISIFYKNMCFPSARTTSCRGI